MEAAAADTTEQPLVSVVVLSYNREIYLRVAIESVLTQTYSKLQILVIDNGSSDGSVQVARSFTDPRITVVELKENIGAIGSFNSSLPLLEGEYVCYLPCDDYIYPRKIERQVDYLKRHPSVGVLGGYMHQVDAQGRETDSSGMDAMINQQFDLNDLRQWHFEHHLYVQAVMYDRRLCQKSCPITPGVDLVADFDLHLRLLRNGAVFHILPEYVAVYRIHDTNLTADKVESHDRFLSQMAYVHATQLVPLIHEKEADPGIQILEVTEKFLRLPWIAKADSRRLAAVLEVLLEPMPAAHKWPTYAEFEAHFSKGVAESAAGPVLLGVANWITSEFAAFTAQTESLRQELEGKRQESQRRNSRIERLKQRIQELQDKLAEYKGKGKRGRRCTAAIRRFFRLR